MTTPGTHELHGTRICRAAVLAHETLTQDTINSHEGVEYLWTCTGALDEAYFVLMFTEQNNNRIVELTIVGARARASELRETSRWLFCIETCAVMQGIR